MAALVVKLWLGKFHPHCGATSRGRVGLSGCFSSYAFLLYPGHFLRLHAICIATGLQFSVVGSPWLLVCKHPQSNPALLLELDSLVVPLFQIFPQN